MSIMTLKEAVQQEIITVGNKSEGIQGDYLDYEPEHKTCVLTRKQTGWKKDQAFETEQLGWRLERFGGQLFLGADDATESQLWFKGKLGYTNGVKALNQMCKELYSSPALRCRAQSITEKMFENMSNIISNKWYWLLGSSCVGTDDGDAGFGMRRVYYGFARDCILYSLRGHADYYSGGVRPVVPLESDIQVEILDCCDGSKERPWHIVVPSQPNQRVIPSTATPSKAELERLLQEGEKSLKNAHEQFNGAKVQLKNAEEQLEMHEKLLEELRKAIADMK